MCTALWQHPMHGPTKCGQCIECRLAYSREWAVRITHEQMMHKESCMLNLTYDDVNLPNHGQLFKADLQRFFKRLRKNTGDFKYVASGEYGDIGRRPHFHIALFGMDFLFDRIYMGKSKSGERLYESPEVERSWTFGNHRIGTLTFESAAYISRYILKKIKGPGADPLPLAVDEDTGEMVFPNPEFMIMSKGIGKTWFLKYFMSDVYPTASVITSQGSKAPVPRYYKSLLKERGPDLAMRMSFIASARAELDLERRAFEVTPNRKSARAGVSEARANLFKRDVK